MDEEQRTGDLKIQSINQLNSSQHAIDLGIDSKGQVNQDIKKVRIACNRDNHNVEDCRIVKQAQGNISNKKQKRKKKSNQHKDQDNNSSKKNRVNV